MAEQSLPGGRIPAPPGTRMAPQNSPLVILVAIGLVVVTLAVLIGFAKRSSELAPDYLSEVVLYALSAACLIMLLALGFLLARNVIKLIVERRRAVPFARFRAKLVAALVGMTLIPSVLVFIVGSEVIRSSAERWFSAPIDDVLTSANAIARSVYQEQQQVVEERAGRLAALLAQVDLDVTDEATIREARRGRGGCWWSGRHRCVPGHGRRHGGYHHQPVRRGGRRVVAARLLADIGRHAGCRHRGGQRQNGRRRAAGRWCGVAARCRRHPSDRRRPGRGGGGGQQRPVRRPDPACQADQRGLRGLQPVARADAPGGRRLPVVLPDDDLDDLDRRDLARHLCREADRPSGAVAGRRGPTHWNRAPRSSDRAGVV